MGQTLSEPVTSKETASCDMEDAHTHLLSVPEDKDACFFAVYDGHGGAKVAQYAGNHLHKRIVQSETYKEDIEEAIRRGFLGIDEDMIGDEEMRDEMAGTTAVVVLIKNGKIYCGNVGDSRAVASVDGLAEPLSYDHKPANKEETRRIIAAGGWVEFNRVNGNLALSRALGDFIFKRNEEKSAKEQIVTAFPDVITRSLSPCHEFIVLACDGIWDVLSNQEVVDFIRSRLAAKLEPEQICEQLLTRCLAPDCQMGGLGCDNMTVVLVCLLQNESWEEFCQKCTRPRPPTPPLDEDSDASPSTFETPPVTPAHRSDGFSDYSDMKDAGGDLPFEISTGVTYCEVMDTVVSSLVTDNLSSDSSAAGNSSAADSNQVPLKCANTNAATNDTGQQPAVVTTTTSYSSGEVYVDAKPELSMQDELPPNQFEVEASAVVEECDDTIPLMDQDTSAGGPRQLEHTAPITETCS